MTTGSNFTWLPLVGTKVWLNHPDGRCLGVVVGYVHDPESARDGQPIIEQQEDEEGFLAKKKGDRFVCHPDFLLPIPYGSPGHRQAMSGGAPMPAPTISV